LYKSVALVISRANCDCLKKWLGPLAGEVLGLFAFDGLGLGCEDGSLFLEVPVFWVRLWAWCDSFMALPGISLFGVWGFSSFKFFGESPISFSVLVIRELLFRPWAVLDIDSFGMAVVFLSLRGETFVSPETDRLPPTSFVGSPFWPLVDSLKLVEELPLILLLLSRVFLSVSRCCEDVLRRLRPWLRLLDARWRDLCRREGLGVLISAAKMSFCYARRFECPYSYFLMWSAYPRDPSWDDQDSNETKESYKADNPAIQVLLKVS
jgi:hypothetical protein